MAEGTEGRITRDDIEAKLRELKGDIDERTAAAKQSATPYLVVGAVLLLVLAYLLGRRVGRRRSTVVEIRRI
jgi:MYXO-CTERM domain-containing protein